jgi:hypothetical protein
MRIKGLILGCALVGGSALGCVRHGAPTPVRGGHDVITVEELAHVREISLYDAVRRLRPHMLRSRAVTAAGKAPSAPLMLYVDGDKRDSIDDLRAISPDEVWEVRFYEPQIANTRFARYNNAGGAIAVVLKRG